MATDLHCPHCEDNLGKDKENVVDVTCGMCGTSFFNSHGYIYDQEHYDQVKKKYPGRKLPRPDNE